MVWSMDLWRGHGVYALDQGTLHTCRPLHTRVQLDTSTSWGGTPATGWYPIQGSSTPSPSMPK